MLAKNCDFHQKSMIFTVFCKLCVKYKTYITSFIFKVVTLIITYKMSLISRFYDDFEFLWQRILVRRPINRLMLHRGVQTRTNQAEILHVSFYQDASCMAKSPLGYSKNVEKWNTLAPAPTHTLVYIALKAPLIELIN